MRFITKRLVLITLALVLFSPISKSQTADIINNRWVINNDGSNSWKIYSRVPHIDNIEMSGEKISAIIHYGVTEKNNFTIKRNLVWPMLKNYPNLTKDNFKRMFNDDAEPNLPCYLEIK
ncbi:MAG TPA: hypothetical protein VNI52_14730 [Sphingobacteriaceae bacterium]|nr:hypothetical protein [Sphingobacteriaceae bacterium]